MNELIHELDVERANERLNDLADALEKLRDLDYPDFEEVATEVDRGVRQVSDASPQATTQWTEAVEDWNKTTEILEEHVGDCKKYRNNEMRTRFATTAPNRQGDHVNIGVVYWCSGRVSVFLSITSPSQVEPVYDGTLSEMPDDVISELRSGV